MSRHRSRSPLHSRASTLLGRRDGYYDGPYHSPGLSDPWRGLENIANRNVEGGLRRDNGSSQTEEQVDHWAKFIEAISRAEKRKASSMSRYHAQEGVQGFEKDLAHSPRRLPRDMLSPEVLHYGMETQQRIQSPGQRRNEQGGAHEDGRYSSSSSPRHSHGKRHDRMEHGYRNDGHEDRYERGSYSERSLKSNYTEHPLHFKGFQDLGPQKDYTDLHRRLGPDCAPLIVEHDHGILKHDEQVPNPGRDRERPRSRDLAREQDHTRNRDPSRDREHPRSRGPVREQELPRNCGPVGQRERPGSHDAGRNRERQRASGPGRHRPVGDREHPRSRDPLRPSDLPRDRDCPKSSEPQRGRDHTRGRESSRTKEPHKHGRDYNHHPGISPDNPGGSSSYYIREDPNFPTFSTLRGSPLRGTQHPKLQLRMGSHSRAVDDGDFRINESNRSRASVPDWEEETQPRRNHGGGQGNVLKRHRNPARMDFSCQETLKIKVDMSRPVGQSSNLGYSSERQLSLDLVNVGRQRLDFLPMLEHSGTFRESAMHSGTFAQEIITLVHQVKEHYFQGQGVTLNERFSNEQVYSLELAEEEQEMEGLGRDVNRPFGSTSSDTQIFCKIGPLQSQRKPHAPAPGDLRHDLDRKRQERLEGVKITIAGGNLFPMVPQSQENEFAYAGDKDPHDAGWSEVPAQPMKQWPDKSRQKKSTQYFNAKRDNSRGRNRPGSRARRNANSGARW